MVLIPPQSSNSITTLDDLVSTATTTVQQHYTDTPCFLEMSALVLDTHNVVCTANRFAEIGEEEFVKLYSGMLSRHSAHHQ